MRPGMHACLLTITGSNQAQSTMESLKPTLAKKSQVDGAIRYLT